MSQSSLYFSTSELESEYNIPTPKTPQRHPESTRDIRLKVQTLYLHAGWTKDDIALQLNLTPAQVQYAIRHRVTPQKTRSGRRLLLGPAEHKKLVR